MIALIADDNKISREILKRIILRIDNWEVVEAEDGEDAWKKLNRMPYPDVCVLDLNMPKIDGEQLLAKLRKHPSLHGVNVIMCTSRNDRETIQRILRYGITYYLLKPYEAQTVIRELQKIAPPAEAPRPTEDPLLVCKRLGIDMKTFGELVTLVVGEISEIIDTFSPMDSPSSESESAPRSEPESAPKPLIIPRNQIEQLNAGAKNLGLLELCSLTDSLCNTYSEKPHFTGHVIDLLKHQKARIEQCLEEVQEVMNPPSGP